MLGYTISIAALMATIWYENRLDRPSMGDALDELEEGKGFNFGDQYWLSYDNSSALAIDKDQQKICLLRAYKGWQQIAYDELVEYEVEETPASAPTGGLFAFCKAMLNPKAQYKNVSVNVLIDNLDCFSFRLNMITTASVVKLRKAHSEAKKVTTILKLVKIISDKQQKQKNQQKHISKRPAQSVNSSQKRFTFNS